MQGVQRFEQARLRRQTGPARDALKARTAKGLKRGRLPALSDAKKAEAREEWANNLEMSGVQIARKYGVSGRTLQTYFSDRSNALPGRRKRKAAP